MNGRHFWFGAVVLASFLLSACANLTWVGSKVYTPPETNILTVEDLGVDDDVAILNPAAFSITRSVANSSSTMAVPGGYTINETIIRWVFQSAGGSAGWVAGDPATHTVFNQDQIGPPLAPGEIQPISFGLIGPLPCGLYQEILTVDDADAVSESSESDNEGLHFFFVPSTQQFNIGVNILDDRLAHNHGTTNTHNFVVNPAGAPAWVYSHFSFVATEGSTATTQPTPPVLAGPGPQTIRMNVTSIEHSFGPLGMVPEIKGKVTVISQDGCVIKRETAQALIEHQ